MSRTPRPPRVLERFVSVCLPREDRVATLEELADLYTARAAARGRRRASLWYARQALSFAWRLPLDRTSRVLRDMRLDLRQAVRQLARAPLFTLVAVASLAIGMGVVIAGYAVYDAVFLRTPPFAEPDRLYRVYTGALDGGPASELPIAGLLGSGSRYGANSYADIGALEASGVFESVGAELKRSAAFALPGQQTRRRSVTFVSPGYFAALRVEPARGRWPAEDAAELALAHWAWQRLLDTVPDVLGRVVRLNGVEHTIVGVAPNWFYGLMPGTSTAAWLPARPGLEALRRSALLTDRRAREFSIVARLAPGVAAPSASERLKAVATGLAERYPEVWRDDRRRPLSFSLLELRDSVVPPSIKPLVDIMVTIVAALLLLVLGLACTNVAGLLLARALGRRHEIAVRRTLGASTPRLLRQLLTESALLAMLGGVAGGVLVYWQFRLLERSPNIAALRLDPDLRVAAAVAGIAALAAIMFGLVPAIQAIRESARSDVASTHTSAPATGRLRGAVIAFQVAVSFVMLLFASFALRGLSARLGTGFAFEPDAVFVVEPDADGFAGDTVRARTFMTELIGTIEAVPGVQRVALAERVPLGLMGGATFPVTLPDGSAVRATSHAVGPGFFDALGIAIVRGRAFDDTDAAGTTAVAVIDRALADSIGPAALGAEIDEFGRRVRVVGVVESLDGSGSAIARPTLYRPIAQRRAETEMLMASFSSELPPGLYPGNTLPQLVVRFPAGSGAEGGGPVLEARLEALIRSQYPEIETPEVQTMRAYTSTRTDTQTAAALFALAAGLVELGLAAIGIYGVLAFTMLARTREIGVRLALGASPGQAGWPVMRSAIGFAAAGIALGALIALPLTRFVETMLVGVRASDPVPFLMAAAAVATAIAAAALGPVRRAARIQPGTALRYE